MAPTIVATDLSKVYRTYKKRSGLFGALQGLVHRDFEETRAVDRVSFSIEQGEFVGFLGPNGAGKTTVLKMLSGLLVPTSGSASVLGFTPWERKPEFKRQFSLVLGQKNSLWWDLPARESLELNRVIYQIPRPTYDKTVDQLEESTRRVAQFLSEDNQKNFNLALKNTRSATEQFDSIARNTDEIRRRIS